MQIDYSDENKNFIIADIDGVLADYPKSFQDFIKDKTGMWVDLQGYDLYEEYGVVIGMDRVYELKHEYRETGQKRFIPLCKGAKKLCDTEHENGCSFIFLTSRPYKEYKRIFADTMEWLKKNGLMKKGDVLFFNEEKDWKIIKDFPNVQYVIEDNSNFALRMANYGKQVVLVDQIYNQNCDHKNILRVKDLEDFIHNFVENNVLK